MCEIASGKLLRELSSVPCDDLEGWDGGGSSKREGVYVCIELIHFIVQQKLTQHWEAIILRLKKNPTENWIKDLLSMAPPIRTRPNFPLSQSLPSGSFYKPLSLLHQRADRLKTTITEN